MIWNCINSQSPWVIGHSPEAIDIGRHILVSELSMNSHWCITHIYWRSNDFQQPIQSNCMHGLLKDEYSQVHAETKCTALCRPHFQINFLYETCSMYVWKFCNILIQNLLKLIPKWPTYTMEIVFGSNPVNLLFKDQKIGSSVSVPIHHSFFWIKDDLSARKLRNDIQ